MAGQDRSPACRHYTGWRWSLVRQEKMDVMYGRGL
jgi:hypothetical protein